MMRPLLLCAATIAALSIAAPSTAGVPDRTASTVGPCLVVCPGGDVAFDVVLRRFGGTLNPGMMVFDLTGAPGFAPCVPNGSEAYVWDAPTRTLRQDTDAFAHASIRPRAGGLSAPGAVTLYADGVWFGTRTLASPDRDGNGTVDPADLAAIQLLLGTNDATADFDCDGAVTIADVAFAEAHAGHSCDAATAAHSSRWGAIKLLYR